MWVYEEYHNLLKAGGKFTTGNNESSQSFSWITNQWYGGESYNSLYHKIQQVTAKDEWWLPQSHEIAQIAGNISFFKNLSLLEEILKKN